MYILVSACLLGINCRYSGDSKLCEDIVALKDKYSIIPVCPEQLGGLKTPRLPAEIKNGRVINRNGNDTTEGFAKGAEAVTNIAKLFGCKYAILKKNSPSCGFGVIYDGNFSGKLVEGNGLAADALSKMGVTVLNEDNFNTLLK